MPRVTDRASIVQGGGNLQETGETNYHSWFVRIPGCTACFISVNEMHL